jgi:hypothetical protein
MREYNLLKFKSQDRLDEGLLKTTRGNYIPFSFMGVPYGLEVCHIFRGFASIKKQDKLKDGMIKFRDGGYVDMDRIRRNRIHIEGDGLVGLIFEGLGIAG